MNMNVHLTNELKTFVQERVDSGRFATASEVIRAGLRALEEDEKWRADVQQRIAAGVAQAKAGQLLDGDEAFDELMERIDERRKMSP